MPLHNWIKCTEDKIQYVRKGVINEDSEPINEDFEAWAKVYDEYIHKFGLSELYKKVLEVMRKRALLQCDYVESGQQFKLTEIAIQEEKLRGMLNNNGNGISIEEALIHLSKWAGYHISAKQITVVEYFTMLKQYGKAN